jgi:hypothetical protein
LWKACLKPAKAVQTIKPSSIKFIFSPDMFVEPSNWATVPMGPVKFAPATSKAVTSSQKQQKKKQQKQNRQKKGQSVGYKQKYQAWTAPPEAVIPIQPASAGTRSMKMLVR